MAPTEPSTSVVATASAQSAFPVLVALTDDGFAAATVHVAEALARRRSAHPALLYIMELTLSATSDGLLGVSTAAMMEALLDMQSLQRDEAALRKTLHLDTGLPATWPFTIELGQVASCLMQRARLSHTALVIMGLHHHGAIGRALGNDTVREVVAFAGVPVLAVRPQLVDLPHSVVVAVDFSHASLRPICAKGNPVAELTRVCEQVQPDLFAIGSQHHPLFERLRFGSVATAMVRDGRWSMLVTPPTEVAV
ncbi:MAG TPA: universal stress protein [Gemmatimonadaceae bacterium]|nr:universal stress protein [Gemmatimonadaceae bacterium]